MEREIRCLIFDFAGTLSPTPYFWSLGAEFCAMVTEAIFTGENKMRWASPWCRGELTSRNIAEYLSGLTGETPERVFRALDEGCANLELNPAIWSFAQTQRGFGRRTALATVNTDVFTRVVVPAHGFDQVFDVIINSADCGVDTKIELCDIAFGQLSGCTYKNSLLIDDSAKSVNDFRARGGMAYQYTDDKAFSEWVEMHFPSAIQKIN